MNLSEMDWHFLKFPYMMYTALLSPLDGFSKRAEIV